MSQTKILPLSAAISERAMDLIDNFALAHGLQLGDALIAATAIEHKLTLLTGNVKHFRRSASDFAASFCSLTESIRHTFIGWTIASQ